MFVNYLVIFVVYVKIVCPVENSVPILVLELFYK